MAVINIELKIENKDEKINKKISGLITNNRIVYIEDDTKTNIEISDIIYMKRENKDYIIELIFDINNKTEGKYLLKEYNKKIDIEVKTNKLNKKNNNINIEYQLNLDNEDMGIFKFNLKYEFV